MQTEKNYISLTQDEGVKKYIIKEGEGEMPSEGQEVEVHYEGRLESNGNIFDSSKTRAPFKFVLGMKQVIPGWEQALSKMKKGEKYRIVIPWYLAYGSYGNGPIPPFTSIVFDVQIVDIK